MSAPPEAPYRGRVLVLDDHDAVRQMLCLALQVGGFETLEATTPYEAYRRLASRPPAALVIDLQDESLGLEVLRYVRAHRDLQDMPIVFLSTDSTRDLQWRALTGGANWFFSKPLSLHELQQRVGALVRQGRALALSARF